MTVALATCDPLPAEADESALEAAFERAGVECESVVWDRACDWSRFEAVLIRTTWDYHERVDDFIAWAREVERATTLLNPADVVAWNCHKNYLLDLAAGGVTIVPTRLVCAGDRVQLSRLAGDEGWSEVVVKPAVSAGAIGACRGRATDDRLQSALENLAGRGDVLVQPFLPAVGRTGETSTIFVAGVPVHSVAKVPAAGDYRSQPEHGGRLRPVMPDAATIGLGRRAIEASSSFTGCEMTYARVDTIEWRGEPHLIELELIEPDLFLSYAEGGSADAVVQAVIGRCGASGR